MIGSSNEFEINAVEVLAPWTVHFYAIEVDIAQQSIQEDTTDQRHNNRKLKKTAIQLCLKREKNGKKKKIEQEVRSYQN